MKLEEALKLLRCDSIRVSCDPNEKYPFTVEPIKFGQYGIFTITERFSNFQEIEQHITWTVKSLAELKNE